MKDFARQLTQKCVSMGLLDESYSEWFACSNIALNEIQTYPFNEKGLLIMKHKKVSQLLAASLSFLMIAMLCVSSVAMEPSMRIGSVTVHSSLFAKMA